MPSTYHSEAAREAAEAILEAFRNPEDLPKRLAQVVLAAGGRHSDRYSWGNQLAVAIRGYTDAAGYKQWRNEYGRQVRKGEKAFPILAPIKRSFTVDETDPETGVTSKRRVEYIVGWRDVKVFGLEQTDVTDPEKWAKHEAAQAEAQQTVEAAPLYEAVTRLGAKISANGHLAAHGILGCYTPTTTEIQLAVENISTFAHEALHFVDDKQGTITTRWGQQPDNEMVAELGGAILLTAMGYETEADLGGCWEYINRYTTKDEPDPLAAIGKLLNRTLDCVAVILAAVADPSDLPEWAS
jgi:hypothetical protein